MFLIGIIPDKVSVGFPNFIADLVTGSQLSLYTFDKFQELRNYWYDCYNMRTFIKKSLVLIFLLSACNFSWPGHPFPSLVDNADSPPAKTENPQQDIEPVECAFVWANKPLPELSDDFNEALKVVQSDAEGYAQAYGENCVTNAGEVIRFHAMETDFYINLKVDDLGDKKALGNLVEDVMGAMTEFPTDETPGPQPGYISITFEASGDELRLRFTQINVQAAIDNGLQGEELFDALNKQ